LHQNLSSIFRSKTQKHQSHTHTHTHTHTHIYIYIYITMVKLASARECRMYGPRLARNRLEYINAGLYLFATLVLLGGFVAQFSNEPKSGLVLLLIALALIILVNVHDLVAHLAGIDCRLQLMELDLQLALVEFAVPVVQTLGSILFFLGILFLFIQVRSVFNESSFFFFFFLYIEFSVNPNR
jgi:hypothetical protein